VQSSPPIDLEPGKPANEFSTAARRGRFAHRATSAAPRELAPSAPPHSAQPTLAPSDACGYGAQPQIAAHASPRCTSSNFHTDQMHGPELGPSRDQSFWPVFHSRGQ
jgi:hypothetical protein